MRASSRMSGAVSSLLVLLLALALLAAPVAASRHALRHKIASSPAPNDAVDLGAPVAHATESSSALLALQGAVARVSASLQSLLSSRRASGSDAAPLAGGDVRRVLDTLASLSQRQSELEQRQAEQSARDHSSLLALVRKQKQQQRAIASQLQQSKRIEQQLQLQQEQAEAEAQADEPQPTLIEQEAQSDSDSDASGDHGSFLEVSLELASSPDAWLSHPHAEHDIDLAHLMDHSTDGDMAEIERRLQLDDDTQQQHAQMLESSSSTRAAGQLDPSHYSSSADYLAAMDSAEHAEDMSPMQFEAFGAQLRLPGHGDSSHEVGTPSRRSAGAHSMSEIDALVAAGEAQHAPKEFTFDPQRLRTPELKQQLASLQDEESIQAAMLRAHARVKAIAAELAKHQSQAGLPHGDGLEINFEGMDMQTEGHF